MTIRMLTDLADVLRAAGLQVKELDGWKTRTETDGRFEPIALLWHHDAMGLGWNTDPNDDYNVPQYMSQNGIYGAQLWVSRYGEWVVLAAGRKWHAGSGSGWGDIPADSGNSLFIGIETDHTFGDPWPDVQVQSILKGSKALAKHYGFKPANCCGHREYAPTRKVDPEGVDLNAWRASLAAPDQPASQWEDDQVSLSPDATQQVQDAVVAAFASTQVQAAIQNYVLAALTTAPIFGFVDDANNDPDPDLTFVKWAQRIGRLVSALAAGESFPGHTAPPAASK